MNIHTHQNIGSFGQTLTSNLGKDASTNIGLEFILIPQLGPRIVRTEGVTVGLVDRTVGDIKLLANEYLEYIVKEGDLDCVGIWQKQAVVKISTLERFKGKPELFSVLC